MSKPMTTETEIRPCKYVFTKDEMQHIAETLAIKTQELESLEDEKKAVASSYKERIETCQMQVRRAARQFKDGFEMRDIECEIRRDYDALTISYIRTDTGEVASIRPMTAAEKQMRLQDAEGAAEPENEKPRRNGRRGGG